MIAGSYRSRVALLRVKDGRLVKIFRNSLVLAGTPSWSPAGLVAFSHAGGCGIDVARENGTAVRRITRLC